LSYFQLSSGLGVDNLLFTDTLKISQILVHTGQPDTGITKNN